MVSSYHGINNKREPEVKQAQVKDAENIIKKLTENQSIRDGILMFFNNYIGNGKYFTNKHCTYIEIIYSEFLKGLETIPEAKINNKGSYNNEVLFYYELSQMEKNEGREFNKKELYTIRDILEHIFRREFGDYKGKYCNKNKHLIDIVSRQEEKIETISIKYMDSILKKNDIEDIQKVILVEKINATGKKRELKKYLIIPSSKLEIEKIALERVLDELIDKFEYKFKKSSANTVEEKIEMLEEFYDYNFKKVIERYLKELNSLEKVRERMMINIKLWRTIIKKYNIKKPDKIYNHEGFELHSQEELIIDDFFHRNNLSYTRAVPTFKYDRYNDNKRYEPDWVINGNIIVEYFGYLDMETKLYTNKTIDKIRYYRQLKDYYFVDIYRENLNQLENVLRIIKKFMK